MLTKFLPSLSEPNKRIYGLDILRSLAILFVLIEHSNRLIPSSISKYLRYLVFDGVTIFFVLSGYLIGSIFIKQFDTQKISGRLIFGFWLKRWLRTLPAYIFTLIILTVFYGVIGKAISFKQFLHFITFTQNLYYPQPTNFFPEAWSLAVEEWFYLILPISVIFLTRTINMSLKSSILIFSILLIGVILGYRIFQYESLKPLTVDTWDTIFRKEVITRLDSIMIGVLGAYIRFYHSSFWEKNNILFLTIGLSISISINYISLWKPFQTFDSVLSFTTLSFGIMLTLPYLSSYKSKGSIFSKFVTLFSMISYSLYLLNFSFIQLLILDNVNLNFIPKFGVLIKYSLFWVLSFSFSYLMYIYIEQPYIRLRNKIVK